MAGSAAVVGDSAEFEEVLRDGVAPDDGVAGLVLKAREHVGVERGIDTAFAATPSHSTNCAACAAPS